MPGRHGLLALLLATAPLAATAQTPRPNGATELPLVPAPREATALPSFAVGRGVWIEAGADADDRFAAADLAETLRARGVPVLGTDAPGAVRVRLLRRDAPAGQQALTRAGLALDAAMVAEGYALVAEGGGAGGGRVDVVGASPAGVFYGAQTVKQLVAGARSRRACSARASATGRRCAGADCTTTGRAARCRRSTTRSGRSARSPRTR
jgi:hexosaminidase